MAIYVPLPGSRRAPLPNSRPAGPIDKQEIASLTVRVRSVGDANALEKLVQEQANQPLLRRQYLTREEYARQYGAASADLDLSRTAGAGARPYGGPPQHGRAPDRQGGLRRPAGRFPRRPPHVSSPLRSLSRPRGRNSSSAAVAGRRDRSVRLRHPPQAQVAEPAQTHGCGIVRAGGPERRRRHGIRETLQLPHPIPGQTLDGSGQTIAIIELGGGFRTSDLKVFFQEIQAPTPKVVSVSVDHAGNAPTSADSADGEVMLDVEVAGAVAPRATFVVYFAPNNGDQGFLDAISAAVHDSQRNPGVLSISWGGPEDPNDSQGIRNFHDLFLAAAAMGVTICVAAGDHGTADEDALSWDGKIHVDHPSVDDMVLSCGGTQIDADGNDVVWNDGTPFDKNVSGGGGWAGGGGISTIIPVPSYQAGANLPVSIDTGKPGRGVPDIAMSATNYFTRVDRMEGASGGTSAVAPLMAALIALLNQAKQKNAGFLNPFLYGSVGKGVFRDVTQGTNAIANTVKGYNAGPGWDACTGLGTPDGTAILNNL